VGGAVPGDGGQPQRDRRRARWPPYSRLQFQHDIGPEGAVYAGSPETVARKIAATMKTLGATRFDLKYANGTLSHAKLMRSIELYGTKVAPLVSEMLSAS
jgi:alkanesulfonate monooxygenase SsuD/methylene tetrahydromethanopterin reductase-like flavin-dependent oxidoreductase (luciferase family)